MIIKRRVKMKNLDRFFLKKTTTGKMIKAFRKNFRISQKEMCEALEITESNLSAVENDRRRIGVDLATRIGAFLGLHPGLLLFPNGEEEALSQHRNLVKKAKVLQKKKLREAM
jgi:transcriptional regulator with XRE-family HTH domain